MLSLLTVAVNAQDKKEDRKKKSKSRVERMENMTPDQMAELQTKQMAVDLDLTDAQQKEIYTINKDQAVKRKEQMAKWRSMRNNDERPSRDEMIKMRSARLDEQKAMQDRMKKILDDDQYAKWKKMQEERQQETRRRMGNRNK
ncbi:hypothetical protein SAMN04487906_3299 [Zhouia amylolytica]|nr:hypothetical protein SAMN04487906_3299 [Zhouia amylolytica]